ncbi:hypothetical protein M2149_000815 [Lachnospiraceae bacterium PFB1-21]
MANKLWSCFTKDMDHCYFTGKSPVERHHIWGAANKKFSEHYGFALPLSPELHPNGVFFNPPSEYAEIDKLMKDACKEYYITYYGTEEDWYNEINRRGLAEFKTIEKVQRPFSIQ